MARGATGYRIILALLTSAPMAFIAYGPVGLTAPPDLQRQAVRDEASGRIIVGAEPSRSFRTAALPQPKKPPVPTETSTPQPDKRSKRSVAFGLY